MRLFAWPHAVNTNLRLIVLSRNGKKTWSWGPDAHFGIFYLHLKLLHIWEPITCLILIHNSSSLSNLLVPQYIILTSSFSKALLNMKTDAMIMKLLWIWALPSNWNTIFCPAVAIALTVAKRQIAQEPREKSPRKLLVDKALLVLLQEQYLFYFNTNWDLFMF